MDQTHLEAEISDLREMITNISNRIDDLGSADQSSTPALTEGHPSQQRFNIAEAIADSVFDKLTKEKACTFEPNDKPCDHCSMCSSLGF